MMIPDIQTVSNLRLPSKLLSFTIVSCLQQYSAPAFFFKILLPESHDVMASCITMHWHAYLMLADVIAPCQLPHFVISRLSTMSLGKLYYSPASCGAASFIAATYTGLQFDSEVVDLKSHKTASGQDFYQVNHKGNVPALATPKGLLSEGPAVLQFIADQAPDSKLAPAFGTFERYQLIDTFNYIGSEVHKAYSPLFKPTWSDETKQTFKDVIYDKLYYVEKNYIGQDPFLNPQQPTIATIYLYVVLGWSQYVGISLDKYPKIKQFLEQVGSHSKIKAAQEKMQAASK